MSREIDERIVAMHFDNQQFEKGAHESLKTLEELKDGLDFEGVGESFEKVSKVASKGFQMKSSTRQVGLFSRAINNMGRVAKSAFHSATIPLEMFSTGVKNLEGYVGKVLGIDLASRLVNAGETVIRAFTIDPLKTGWSEYELKMDSIKTIMTGTANEFKKEMGDNYSEDAHLARVKEQLEELNKYADDTIYSFADMTSNIGKFTNSGVKLDDAVSSIKGIANAAAQAGQGTQEASRAMYNLSQAIGMGKLTTIDWKSVEQANIATIELKNTFIESAVAMGKLEKKGDKYFTKTNKKMEVTAENFRDTLTEGWADKDVITTALKIYSGDLSLDEIGGMGFDVKGKDSIGYQLYEAGQAAKKAATEVRTFSKMWDALKEAAQSGWAMSWEYIVGDMKEGTTLWTVLNERISDWVSKSAEARNNLLKGWRGQITDSDLDAMTEFLKAADEVDWSKYEHNTFMLADNGFRDFTNDIVKMLSDPEKSLEEIQEYLHTKYDIDADDALKAIEAVRKQLGKLDYFGKDGRVALIEGVTTLMDAFETAAGGIKKAWRDVFGVKTPKSFQNATEKFLNLAKQFKEMLGSQDDPTSLISKLTHSLSGLFSVLKIGKKAITVFVSKGVKVLKQLLPDLGKVSDKLAPFTDWVIELANQFEKDGSFSHLFETIGAKISEAWQATKANLESTWGEIKIAFEEDGLGGALSVVKKKVREYLEDWGIDFTPVDQLAEKIGKSLGNLVGKIEKFFGLEEGSIVSWYNKIIEFISGIGKKRSEDGDVSAADGEVEESISFIERVINVFTGLKDSVVNFINWAKEADWSDIGQTFYSSISGLGTALTVVGAGAATVGAGSLLHQVAKVPKRLTNIEGSLGGILSFETGKTTLDKVGDVLGDSSTLIKNTATVILEFSVALYLLADSIKTLSQIDDAGLDRAKGAISELTTLIAAFSGIIKLENSLFGLIGRSSSTTDFNFFGMKFSSNKNGKVNKVGDNSLTGMIGFVLAIHELVNDVIKLGELPKPDIDKAVLAIGELSGVIALFEGISKFENAGISKWLISDNRTGWIGKIFGTKSVKGASIAESTAFVIAIRELVDSIIVLADIPEDDLKTAGNAIGQLSAVIALFEGFSKFENAYLSNGLINTGKFGKIFGVKSVKGASISESIAFVSAVQGLVNALIDITKIPEADIGRAGNALAQLTAIIALFEGVTKFENSYFSNGLINTGTIGKLFGVGSVKGLSVTDSVAFVVAIQNLVDALIELTKISEPDIKKAGDALGHLSALTVLFEGVMKAESVISSNNIKNVGTLGNFLGVKDVTGYGIDSATAFVSAISTLVNGLVTISSINEDDIGKAEEALGILAAIIALFEGISKFENTYLSNNLVNTGTVGKIFGQTSVQGASIKESLAFVASIHEVVNDVIKLANISEEDLGKAEKAIGILTTLIAAFEGIVKLENSLIGLIGRSERTTNRSFLGWKSTTSSTKNAVNGNSLSGAIGFVIAIHELVKDVIELSAVNGTDLTKAEGSLAKLEGLIAAFDIVGKLANKFIGSNMTGGERIANAIAGLGETVSFVKSISAMVGSVVTLSKADPDRLEKAASVLTVLTTLLAAFNAVTELENTVLTGDKVTKQLVGSFGNLISTVGLIVAITAFVLAVKELAKVEDQAGLRNAADIVTEIGGVIIGFGALIAVTAKVFAGGSAAMFKGSAVAAVSIMEFIAIIGAIGGLIGLLLESVFGTEDVVKTLENAGKVMRAIGGLLGSFISGIVEPIASIFQGEKHTLGETGDTLAGMSGSLEALSEVGENLNMEGIYKMKEALDVLKTIAEERVSDPTWFEEFFKGEMSISEFVSRLPGLAENLASFNSNLGDADFSKASGATESLRNLAQAYAAFGEASQYAFIYGDEGVITAMQKILDLNSDSASWVAVLSAFSKIYEPINTGIDQAALSINVTPIIDSITSGIESKKGQISETLSKMFDGSSAESTPKENGEEAGTEYGMGMFDGIQQVLSDYGYDYDVAQYGDYYKELGDALESGASDNDVVSKLSNNPIFQTLSGIFGGQGKEDAQAYLDGYGSAFESVGNGYMAKLLNLAGVDLTPVLGMDGLSGLLSGNGITITGDVGIKAETISTITTAIDGIKTAVTTQGQNIVTAINAVNSSVETLDGSIASLKIVLDTGAVAAAVDSRLGTRVSTKGRVLMNG